MELILGLLLTWAIVGTLAALLFGAAVRFGEGKSRRELRQRVRRDLVLFPISRR